MRGFVGLTKRNIMVYFRDRQAVFFSILTSIIVLALYILFLRQTFVDSIMSVVDSVDGLRDLISQNDIEVYSNLILLTGILGSALITVPFNCASLVVRDREKMIDYDICVTPLKRWQIVLSYFTSSAVSSIVMNVFILTAALLILNMTGEIYLSAADIVAAYFVMALGSVSATAVFMPLALMFKTSQASGAFFGMLSAAAGFVIGAYIPTSQFSGSVQTLCNLFPASHVTILLRNVLLGGVLDKMDADLNGIDGGMFADAMKKIFSFNANMFGKTMNIREMFIYVVCVMAGCVAIMVYAYSRTYKRR